MRDNTTSQPAQEYDRTIEKTIPRYGLFHEETIRLVEVVHPHPGTWLDTGGGTGTLVLKAADQFATTQFVLADPSEAMINIAKQKVAGQGNEQVTCLLAGTENIQYAPESFEVITAILAHHYLGIEARMEATTNCFNMLKQGGLYITFETIMPSTAIGTRLGLERWRRAQLHNGKSREAVDRHISRFGSELSPIAVAQHLSLLQQVGFSVVEILWASGMQAGFYAIK